MSNFVDLLDKPLPSRVEELKEYMFETVMEETGSEDDVEFIGCLNLPGLEDYITEDDTLGKINMKGKIKTVVVAIWQQEGWAVPHLHVYNEYFKTAIKLDVPEYFHHGKYKGSFNNNQAKLFDKFMREEIPYTNTTRWESAKADFNRWFSDHPVKVKEQPDYTKLNEKKGSK